MIKCKNCGSSDTYLYAPAYPGTGVHGESAGLACRACGNRWATRDPEALRVSVAAKAASRRNAAHGGKEGE